MARKTARETAMQLLFESEFNAEPYDTMALIDPKDLTGKDKAYIETIRQGVRAHLEQIDAYLARYSIDWPLARMAKVDKSILRLAVYEILYTDTPNAVAASEAVAMARLFSTEQAAPFINGLLGSLIRDHESDTGN